MALSEQGTYDVWVGDLDLTLTEQDLQSAFEKCGKVVKCRVMKKAGTSESRGFGFVSFESQESQKRAVDEFQNYRIKSQNIQVRIAHSKQRSATGDASSSGGHQSRISIFVGSLPRGATDEDLKTSFEAFGKVESVRVFPAEESVTEAGYGFVNFAEPDAQQSALAKGRWTVKGSQVEVLPSKSNRRKPVPSAGGGGGAYYDPYYGEYYGGGGGANAAYGGGYGYGAPGPAPGDVEQKAPLSTVVRDTLYVGNLPREMKEEEATRKIEALGGKYKSIIAKRGYCFVTYGSFEDAELALAKLKSSSIDGKMIRPQFSRNSGEKTSNEYGSRLERSKRTLFIQNIPDDVSEATLRDKFEIYGNTKNVSIVTDKKTGAPRGFGFIEFVSEEEAKEAVRVLHRTPYRGKTLSVEISRPPDAKGAHGADGMYLMPDPEAAAYPSESYSSSTGADYRDPYSASETDRYGGDWRTSREYPPSSSAAGGGSSGSGGASTYRQPSSAAMDARYGYESGRYSARERPAARDPYADRLVHSRRMPTDYRRPRDSVESRAPPVREYPPPKRPRFDHMPPQTFSQPPPPSRRVSASVPDSYRHSYESGSASAGGRPPVRRTPPREARFDY